MARLGDPAWVAPGLVYQARVSPDGARLATLGIDGLSLWSISDGRRVATLPLRWGGLAEAAPKPRMAQVVWGPEPGMLTVLQLDRGLQTVRARDLAVVAQVDAPRLRGVAAAGSSLVTVDRQGGLERWRGGRVVARSAGPVVPGAGASVARSVTTSGSARAGAKGGASKVRDAPWPLAVSADRKTLGVGTPEGKLLLASASGLKVARVVGALGQPVVSVGIGPGGRRLAAVGREGHLAVFQAGEPAPIFTRELGIKGRAIGDPLALARAGDVLYAVQAGGSVLRVDLGSGATRSWPVTRGAELLSLGLGPKGRQLVATRFAFFGGRLELLRTRDGTRVRARLGHDARVRVPVFSPSGDFLATGDEEGRVVVWKVDERRSVRQLDVSTAPVRWMAFTPEGRRLVTSDDAFGLQMHDWTDGAEVFRRNFDQRTAAERAKAARDRGTSCAWRPRPRPVLAPTGDRLVLLGERGLVSSLSVEDGAVQQRLGGAGTRKLDARFTSTGRVLVTVDEERKLARWDLEGGSMMTLRQLPEHPPPPRAPSARGRKRGPRPERALVAALSPDAQTVAWTSSRVPARIFLNDTATAARLLEIDTGGGLPGALVFSRSGQTLIGTSKEKIRIWRARDGSERATLEAPSKVLGLDVSPQRDLMVTAHEDGALYLWRP